MKTLRQKQATLGFEEELANRESRRIRHALRLSGIPALKHTRIPFTSACSLGPASLAYFGSALAMPGAS